MKTFTALLAVAGLTICSANSFATTILSYSGLFRNDAAALHVQVGSNAVEYAYVGVLKFTDSSNLTYLTMCADLLAPVNGSAHNYATSNTNPGGTTGLDRAGRITATYLQSVVSDTSAVGVDKQAGLQLAVWSAIYDNASAFSATGPQFKVTDANAATLSYAASYYTAANGSSIYFQSNQGGAQSQLTVNGVTSAPEPTAFGFLALGAVGALARRKYGKKSTR